MTIDMLKQLIGWLFAVLDIFEEITNHINPHLIFWIEFKETDSIIKDDLTKNEKEPLSEKWIL